MIGFTIILIILGLIKAFCELIIIYHILFKKIKNTTKVATEMAVQTLTRSVRAFSVEVMMIGKSVELELDLGPVLHFNPKGSRGFHFTLADLLNLLSEELAKLESETMLIRESKSKSLQVGNRKNELCDSIIFELI